MSKPYSSSELFVAQLKGIEELIDLGRLQAAAEQLNVVGKAAAHDPRIFLLASRLAEAANNPEGMLFAAQKAHQLAPHWPNATIHLASVLASVRKNEPEAAIAVAKQAVAQASNDTELLTRAAVIAQWLAFRELALVWLRQAEKIKPEDRSIRYKIGLTLAYNGDPNAATDVFTKLLEELPDNKPLLAARLEASLASGKLEQAIQDGTTLVQMEPENEVYQYHLAIARGQTPKTQPSSIVATRFDGMAADFDQHLVVHLKYRLPRDVARMIQEWHPDRKVDILDLGCGTGLLGVCLGRIEGALIGVDLSLDMIGQATRHNVYDRFHHVNLIDALGATPPDHYNVIAALDALVYVGDLAPVIPNAFRILVPGGHFVFSCESGTGVNEEFSLEKTGRFTHDRSYVLGLLEAAGFDDVVLEDRVIRQELGEPVQGYLVAARKPPQVVEKTARRASKTAKSLPTA